MAYVNLDKMSVNEIKVYVAELEAKIKVYESVIANSNFRAIVIRPDEDKPKYPRSYRGKKSSNNDIPMQKFGTVNASEPIIGVQVLDNNIEE